MSFIQTFLGKIVYPLSLGVDDINIHDIAHSLSLQCRFNGHSQLFYSVGEHSCRVSDLCPLELKEWGLLHDAGEAYLSDLPSPLKKHMPYYIKKEEKILKIIGERFWLLPWKLVEEEINKIDLIVLATESRDVMSSCEKDWAFNLGMPLEEKIIPWSWQSAEIQFLHRAKALNLL